MEQNGAKMNVYVLTLLFSLLSATDQVFVGSNVILDADNSDIQDQTPTHQECMSALQTDLYRPHNLSSPDWDATGWPSPGLLQGNLVWLGRFEDCKRLQDGLYCLSQASAKVTAQSPLSHSNQSTVQITWGICAVQACNSSIIQENFKDIFKGVLGLDILEADQSVVNCALPSEKSKGFYATIGVCAFLVLLSLLGTLMDLRHRYLFSHHPNVIHRIDGSGAHLVSVQHQISGSSNQEGEDESPSWERPPDQQHLIRALKLDPGSCTKFWMCFSLLHHVENLFKIESTSEKSKSRVVPCLDGLRVLSIVWIMLGHTYLGAYVSGLMDNPLDALDLPKHLLWQFVGNAYFAVDTFFLLSGFLVAYLTLPVMTARDGKLPIVKFYIFRYIRLTPVVGVVMLVWMFFLPHVAEGPLWFNMQNDPICQNYWWPNLLYIQNFYPVSLQNVCIGWVWYLALDMQFYIISPILLIALYRSYRKGVSLILILAIASLIVLATLIGYYNIDINLTLSVLNGDMKAMEDYESIIYGKPYCRIVPYLVGIILGYRMALEDRNKKYIAKPFVALGWITSIVVMVTLVLAFYSTFSGRPFSLAENILYGTFSHLGWAVAIGWIVYACHHGYGGLLNDFLSWHWWGALSKLTFAVYMFHPLVMFTFNFSQKATFHMDTYHMVMRYSGFLVLSFLGAVGLHVLVEMPFIHLMKFLSASPRSN